VGKCQRDKLGRDTKKQKAVKVTPLKVGYSYKAAGVITAILTTLRGMKRLTKKGSEKKILKSSEFKPPPLNGFLGSSLKEGGARYDPFQYNRHKAGKKKEEK